MTAIIEDAKSLDITTWGTLNTAASPGRLPDGHSPNNQNVWMDEKPGSVVTAKGYTKLGTIPSNNPPTFQLNFFKTSDGSSQLLVSDNESIWWTTDYVNYTLIKSGLSRFFQLRGKVIRDKAWLTNGSNAVMTWDGASLVELDGTSSKPDVPTGKYIEYHDERVWIYGISSDLSSCRFSSLADSSGTEITPDDQDAWPDDNELQISEGDADQGTGIFLYRGYLYCSKQFSIFRIVGYDEYTYQRVKTRSSTGTRFQESIQIKDDIVHFIGVDGLYQFDGENSKRISDIIDPASPEDGVFAFRNLQQPLLSNKFWNVSETVDLDNGTYPATISVANDEIALVPADTTQADFQAGVTQTNINTTRTPGSILLQRNTSGTTNTTEDIALNQSVQAKMQAQGGSLIESPSNVTDGAGGSVFGFNAGNQSGGQSFLGILVNLSRTEYITRVRMARVLGSGQFLNNKIYVNTGAPVDISTINLQSVGGNFSLVDTWNVTISQSEQGHDASFSAVSASQVLVLATIGLGQFYFGSLNVYPSGYPTTGEFISKTIDYGVAPATFGRLAATDGADVSSGTDHCNVNFYTQSSADGVSWDGAVAVSNGAVIGSTVRRYLRGGASFTSDTADTFVVSDVYVGGTYISEIHDTGGDIQQWGALAVDESPAGQTINFYYRAAATSGGVSASLWTAIVPGAVPNTAITNTFIQFRIEMSNSAINANTAGTAPIVHGFTVNWVLSSSSGAAVLQNVASIIILNRYWLAAATLGADANDIVLVLGKSTFNSPWHKKDFQFLSFCKFQDIFIAGSSIDGSLYHIDYGYSKDGAAMDSFYETRDYSDEGQVLKGREILVYADRSGPYDLSFGWSTDGGMTYTEKTIDLTRATGASLGLERRLNINFMAPAVRFRVRTNAADQPFSVDEAHCYYKPTIQRGDVAA